MNILKNQLTFGKSPKISVQANTRRGRPWKMMFN